MSKSKYFHHLENELLFLFEKIDSSAVFKSCTTLNLHNHFMAYLKVLRASRICLGKKVQSEMDFNNQLFKMIAVNFWPYKFFGP